MTGRAPPDRRARPSAPRPRRSGTDPEPAADAGPEPPSPPAADAASALQAALLALMPPPGSGHGPGSSPGRAGARPGTSEPAIGVAVSGGSDSTALLLAAVRLPGLRVEAATVDHRLRPEAAAEARAVAALCAELDIPHAALVWQDGPAAAAGPGNLAEAARDARARLLADWARDRGLAAVALGHTRDDQAETLLLRLARGSGLDGLAAMRARSERLGMTWLRPALGLSREALRAWLRAEGVAWHDDPSNADLARDRPRARAALATLAPLGLTAERLARTAARLAEDADHLAAESLALIRRIAAVGPAGEVRLDRAGFGAAPSPLRRRAVARLLTRLSGAAHAPRAASLEALAQALQRGETLRRTLHGVSIGADPTTIHLSREPARAPESVAAGSVWDGRWRLETSLVGTRMRLGALETAGLAALKRAERDRGWTPAPAWNLAPQAAKRVSPALWEGETLLSAPLAGYGSARAIDAVAAEFGLEPAPVGHVCSR